MKRLIVFFAFILFNCTNDDGIYFQLSEETIDVNFYTTSVNINISTNTEWEIINLPDWATVDSQSGNGDINLVISLTKNDQQVNGEFQSRTAEILFVANNKTYLLRLVQGSLNDIFITTNSPRSYDLEYNSQTITVEVSSNKIWELTNSPDWIDVSLESGEGNMVEVTFTIEENLTGDDREGYVIFGIVNPHFLSFTIKQNKIPLPIKWELLTDFEYGVSSFTRHLNMTVDINGNPFVGSSTSLIGGDAYFYEFNGNSWESKGTFEAYNPKIIINSNNTPYVLYEETPRGQGGVEGFASLRRLNNNWEIVEQNFSSGRVSYMDLSIDSNDFLYTVYRNHQNSGKIEVQKYDGASLSIVGTTGFSDGSTTYCQIEIDNNDIPIVGYIDSALSNQLVVKKFDGSTWGLVGTGIVSDGAASHVKLKTDSGSIVVAYKDISNSSRVSVKKFNNGVWETIGTNVASDNPIKSFAISAHNGLIYFAFIDSNTNSISVRKHTGTAWEDMSMIPVDITENYHYGVEEIKLVTNSNGTLFISFKEKERGAISVIKYNN